MQKGLALAIMNLMVEQNPSPEDGREALCHSLFICLIDDGFDKEQGLKIIGDLWDKYEHPVRRMLKVAWKANRNGH